MGRRERHLPIALGDAWITHDPIAAQGANLGSRCAFLLGELITTSLSYDQQFCLEVERKMGELALAPTALSLAMLEPPGPELNHLLARAATDPAVADRFADGFAHPDAWSPASTPPRPDRSAGDHLGVYSPVSSSCSYEES